MDNPENLATYGTQDEDKQRNHRFTWACVDHLVENAYTIVA
jgi:hypothetical protein